MATGTAGDTGHRLHFGALHAIVRRFSYSDWTGTNNDAHVVGVLPPRAMVLPTLSGVLCITGFDDTSADDLDVGISGSDDDLFHSNCDINSAVFTAFDDLAAANHYSATARTVTMNFQTAPTGDGTAGEGAVIVVYTIIPAAS